jgi:hypothetical protein
VRDAGIVAPAQAVEHYEMARYGTIVAWAKAVGADDVAHLMQETLEGEKKADATLNQLARREINQQAVKQVADDRWGALPAEPVALLAAWMTQGAVAVCADPMGRPRTFSNWAWSKMA